jgi:hypothetical protein
MKHTLFLLLVLTLSGCAATQVEKARKKIPAGQAGSLNVTVTTLGGWGGKITGKGITSDGRGRLTADEYSETVNSPWVTYTIDLVDAAIGKQKLIVKPAAEVSKSEVTQ